MAPRGGAASTAPREARTVGPRLPHDLRRSRAPGPGARTQADGDIQDVGQLVFELHAFMLLANALFVISHDPAPMRRARRAIERRIGDLGAEHSPR